MTDQERKLAAAAIFTASANGEEIEWHDSDEGKWMPADPFSTMRLERDNVFAYPEAYRIKPKPKTRPWSGPKDLPMPLCWMRNKNTPNLAALVVCVSEKSITFQSNILQHFRWSEAASHLHNMEHSTDGKTWHPCTVEEPCNS